jgi:hypothetical protein
MHIHRVRNYGPSNPNRTMNVLVSEKRPVNTLYGPDDKPLAYMYEVEPIKFGFQPSGESAIGDAAPLERV